MNLFKNINGAPEYLKRIDEIYNVLFNFRKSLYTYKNIDKIKEPYKTYLQFQKDKIDKYYNTTISGTTRFSKLFKNTLSRVISEFKGKKSLLDIIKETSSSDIVKPKKTSFISNASTNLKKVINSLNDEYKKLKQKITKNMSSKQKEEIKKKNDKLDSEKNKQISEIKSKINESGKTENETRSESATFFDELDSTRFILEEKEKINLETISKSLGKDIGDNCKYLLRKIKSKIKDSILQTIRENTGDKDFVQQIVPVVDLLGNFEKEENSMVGGAEINDIDNTSIDNTSIDIDNTSIETKLFLDQIISFFLNDEVYIDPDAMDVDEPIHYTEEGQKHDPYAMNVDDLPQPDPHAMEVDDTYKPYDKPPDSFKNLKRKFGFDGGKSNHKKTLKKFKIKTMRNKSRHRKTNKNKRIKKIIMIRKTNKRKTKNNKRKTFKRKNI